MSFGVLPRPLSQPSRSLERKGILQWKCSSLAYHRVTGAQHPQSSLPREFTLALNDYFYFVFIPLDFGFCGQYRVSFRDDSSSYLAWLPSTGSFVNPSLQTLHLVFFFIGFLLCVVYCVCGHVQPVIALLFLVPFPCHLWESIIFYFEYLVRITQRRYDRQVDNFNYTEKVGCSLSKLINWLNFIQDLTQTHMQSWRSCKINHNPAGS